METVLQAKTEVSINIERVNYGELEVSINIEPTEMLMPKK
jgi:hypothetical protein